MKLPLKKINALANQDYEKAWLETKEYLKMEGHLFDLKPQGVAHPLKEFLSEARVAMIQLGFEELVLPMFVDEEDVYKEYGPEAALILDRLYYLAELPRPDIAAFLNKKSHKFKRLLLDLIKSKNYKIFSVATKKELSKQTIWWK